MAKKKDETEQTAIEPVTNCDQFMEVVTNCDHLGSIDIRTLIHVVRGQQVLIDRDLAMLYNVGTKALNQAVKRNINRFPADFMFQLTEEEHQSLRSQFVTLNREIESLRSQNATLKDGRGQHLGRVGVHLRPCPGCQEANHPHRQLRGRPCSLNVHQACRRRFGHDPHPLQRAVSHRPEETQHPVPRNRVRPAAA